MPNRSKTVGEEISHLVKDKGWKQDRAVAASLNMQRKGELKPGNPKKDK